MKTPFLSILFSAFVCLGGVFSSVAVPAQSVSVDLKRAVYAEESEGDLDRAMEIYRRIVAENSRARQLVAEAQFRLAMCHLKKGETETALAEFGKTVSLFPEQSDWADAAREQLKNVGSLNESIQTTIVWRNAPDPDGNISPDGRYFSFQDPANGDLAIKDLQTGKISRLTDKGSWEQSDDMAMYGMFSRDGKQMVFSWVTWENPESARWELRIIDLETKVVSTIAADAFMQPIGWSSTGEFVYAYTSPVYNERNREYRWERIRVSDRTRSIIRTIQPGRGLLFPTPSPDDRFWAYEIRGTTQPSTLDIEIMSVDDGKIHPCVSTSAKEQIIGWHPDGGGLFYTRDAGETKDLWFSEIDRTGRKKSTPAELVYPNVGSVWPRSITRQGAFYYSTSADVNFLHKAKLDIENGTIKTAPEIVNARIALGEEVRINNGTAPANIVFFKWPGAGPRGKLSILDSTSGSIAEVPCKLEFLNGRSAPQTSLDGKHVMMRGLVKESKKWALLFIELKTGKIVTLDTETSDYALPNMYGMFQGDAICYVRLYGADKRITFVRYDRSSETRTETEIGTQSEEPVDRYRFMMKPGDARYLYLKRRLRAEGGTSSVVFVRRNLDTGGEIEVARAGIDVALHFVDNDQTLFVSLDEGKDNAIKFLVRLDSLGDRLVERFRIELPADMEVSWPLGDMSLFGTRKSNGDEGPKCSLHLIETSTGRVIDTGLELDAESIRIAGVFPDGIFYFYQTPQTRFDIWKLDGLISRIAK